MEITRPAAASPNCSTAPARPAARLIAPLSDRRHSFRPPPGLVSGDGKLPERTASMRLSAASQPASFECSCGGEHRAADGLCPWWTARHGACWCPDCTRSGAPAASCSTAAPASGGGPPDAAPPLPPSFAQGAEIATSATHRLQRHRDDLIDASEAVGVGGVVLGVVCVLWMLTRCGPTLLPGLFG
jgi:hypothetical protein